MSLYSTSSIVLAAATVSASCDNGITPAMPSFGGSPGGPLITRLNSDGCCGGCVGGCCCCCARISVDAPAQATAQRKRLVLVIVDIETRCAVSGDRA